MAPALAALAPTQPLLSEIPKRTYVRQEYEVFLAHGVVQTRSREIREEVDVFTDDEDDGQLCMCGDRVAICRCSRREQERRIDPQDGEALTLTDFIDQYSGTEARAAAPRNAPFEALPFSGDCTTRPPP